jgi:outer membrane murein-binding lipoprotein Lpp
MAAVPAAARALPAPQRPQPAVRPRTKPRVRVASGVLWIVVIAVLLAGVVALNVTVLRLNVRLDELSHRRADLQAENAALESRISQAAARTETMARQHGLVPANPDLTTFVELGARRR